MSLAFEQLKPFGLLVNADVGTTFRDLRSQVEAWVREHRVVVLRNLAALTKAELPIAARELGPLQSWNFGSVHELRVDRSASNYLYTDHAVPLHWDGAFAGAAPSYLVFHCLEAPAQGGETVFVDTARVWQGLPEETRDRFRSLELRYSTEKKAHYGGSFVAPLVTQHELRGDTVLRFAEPVDDKNPVRVEVMGEGPLVSAGLLREIRSELANPASRLELAWQPGDVVIADNLGLLHGRKAFGEAEARHIRRVNVLQKRARSWKDALADSLRIRRPEFMVAELPIFLIPLLLAKGAAGWSTIASLLATFLLLFHVGDMVNCLADRDLDLVWKPRLAESVRGLGVSNVKLQIAGSSLAALALAFELSLHAGSWIPLSLVAVGLALGLSYSLRPLYLKGRGLLQIPTLVALIFVGPMLLVWSTLGGELSVPELGFFLVYGLMQQGIILLNTAEDIPEDRAAFVHTSALALGLRGSVAGSFVMVALGGGLVVAFLGAALFAAGHVVVLAMLPLSATLAALLSSVASLWLRLRGKAEAQAIIELRVVSKLVPVWIALTAASTLLAVGVLQCW